MRPHGGGDCRELTYKGMIDAFDANPLSDSPLYVFTDAGPKDATKANDEYLTVVAKDKGFVINFFVVKKTGCIQTADILSFQKIAQATMGQVFELKDYNELEQLEGLTATSLGGTTIVATAIHKKSARKKRSSSKTSNNYPISVDDSIDTLIIYVTADQPTADGNMWSVSLTSPTGTVSTKTHNLNQGTVYQISKPNVGIWGSKQIRMLITISL